MARLHADCEPIRLRLDAATEQSSSVPFREAVGLALPVGAQVGVLCAGRHHRKRLLLQCSAASAATRPIKCQPCTPLQRMPSTESNALFRLRAFHDPRVSSRAPARAGLRWARAPMQQTR